ncbi:MAG TPA: PTS sugar transporter subunit IIA [Syntrophales bacterium]|jgi:PTS system nitrogen regulatory IIA component|nr:PTS sugar transporter subunit IIA [Syntrophales bacterium]HON23417.1 PTS sugar transporter subunit IIA [Syntrophales bacterium]HOU77006.1 PTS sugar transporter subunit IIA [Syntrophales bacterium]HPC32286.1 PTS sugar transporter subunit IIA [Syntrophales bacterium]HQG34028.1 PTS sugar transporter subunit IIA [Syntrophales bacterium]
MKIAEILKQDYIVEHMRSRTKRDVLEELATVILGGREGYDPEATVNVLMEREKLGSTGIGDGIAIPHGKLAIVNEMAISFGKSPEGIDFNAMDGKPVHLFFLLLAPENAAGQHLKMLAKLSKMLKDESFRNDLLVSESRDELLRVILEKDDAC